MTISTKFESLQSSKNVRRIALIALRMSLGSVFLWFGGMKTLGYDPVYHIINQSFPMLATPVGNIILGIFEFSIGFGLVTNLLPRMTALIMGAHMLGTFAVFVLAPAMMFSPSFPILTVEGEFVFKNIVFVAAGLVVLLYQDSASS